MSNTRITDEWGLFSAIPDEFIDNAAGLSDQARWLFVLLRRYTNKQTGIAFPSYGLIQEQTGWTPKTIAKAVRELEAAGWLSRKKAFSASTEYTLLKPGHFPQGSIITSHREVMHFPQGSNVLPVGKSIKSNTRHKKDKAEDRRRAGSENPHSGSGSDLSAGSRNPHYDRFASAFQAQTGYPYQSRKADFVRFAAWKKADDGRTSLEGFEKAIENYFASPQGSYTFADLLSRFATFRLTALDRYGKPVESEKTPTPGSAAPLPRPAAYCGNCESGWILPDTAGGRARKCECSRGPILVKPQPRDDWRENGIDI